MQNKSIYLERGSKAFLRGVKGIVIAGLFTTALTKLNEMSKNNNKQTAENFTQATNSVMNLIKNDDGKKSSYMDLDDM